MKRGMVIALVLGALVVTPAFTAAAEDPEDVAARVSQQIMSPFCDGVTLHDCPSGASDKLRTRIVTMARSGMSEEDIISNLEAEYGDRIAASPGNPLAWVIPGTAVVLALGLAATLARRWTRSRTPEARRQISDEDRARIEAEVAAYRGQP